jgi:hypothetical protein
MKKRFKGSSQSYIWACLLGLGLSGMTALAQVHPSPDKPASVVKQDEEAGRWLMTQMALLESLRQLPE